MERVEFINSRGLRLVGNFHRARSGAGVVLAHGFTSDKSAVGRFDSLSSALHKAGYSVLAFDFSGCGESDAEILAAHNMVDDLRCAIDFVKNNGCSKVALYGHSLGGLICLKCAAPDIATMALSGAPTDKMFYNWREFYTEAQLSDLRERGMFVMVDRTGKERTIGRQMLRDFEEIDQQTLLGNVPCPVLLIHGSDPADEEEILLLDRSRRGIDLLPAGSRLEVIDGANHTFIKHWDRVIALAVEWYLHHIPV